MKDCMLPGTQLKLVDESGAEVSTGESATMLSRIYALTTHSRGRAYYSSPKRHQGILIAITTILRSPTRMTGLSFKTGDIYAFVGDQRLVWKGRKEDYIQVCFNPLIAK